MKNILQLMIIAICSIGFLIPQNINAQTSDNPTWMSFYFGHQEYKGEYGNEMLKFDVPNNFGGGVGLQQYLNPSFNLDLSMYLGKLDWEYANSPFSKRMFNSNLSAHYKFTNGYIFDENSAVQPFVFAGIGYTSFFQGNNDEIPNTQNFQVPLGVGVNVPLSKSVQLNYKSTYNRTLGNDQIDNRAYDANSNDYFLVHTIGVKLRLGSTAKQDMDNDGFADNNDACPTEAGIAQTNGCPDRDEDYIADRVDRCPNIAGVETFGGCPDTDADMIPNSEDACPEIAGVEEFNGCAEAQTSDAKPVAISDIKDTDDDGVINKIDNCVYRAGVPSNNGCPIVAADIEQETTLIFNNIYFATDSAEIHESSEEHLDDLAEIMKDDEDLLLHVDGYADSRSTDAYNMELSIDRAEAVEEYLVEQGIDDSRITTEGHGENQPIATNETQFGKSKNRRVTLEFSYQ